MGIGKATENSADERRGRDGGEMHGEGECIVFTLTRTDAFWDKAKAIGPLPGPSLMRQQMTMGVESAVSTDRISGEKCQAATFRGAHQPRSPPTIVAGAPPMARSPGS